MYTVIQAILSLLYNVAKCHFFSVVAWKYIIKYLQKCEGCTSVRYCIFNSTIICIALFTISSAKLLHRKLSF